MEYVLFFIGLGFFLYVIFLIERSDEKRYDRLLSERREFGYQKQKRRLWKQNRKDLSGL